MLQGFQGQVIVSHLAADAQDRDGVAGLQPGEGVLAHPVALGGLGAGDDGAVTHPPPS